MADSNAIGPVLTEALGYWEPRRVAYNAALATIVAGHAWWTWPTSGTWMNATTTMGLIVLAGAANVLYCAAYLVDLPVQFSGHREGWRKWRGGLWLAGTVLAMALATLVCGATLEPPMASQ